MGGIVNDRQNPLTIHSGYPNLGKYAMSELEKDLKIQLNTVPGAIPVAKELPRKLWDQVAGGTFRSYSAFRQIVA